MKYRVFIDTNVFIYAFEFPESNSSKIIELLNNGQIGAVISERVVKEVIRYFEKHHNLKLARTFRKYLIGACLIIPKESTLNLIDKYRGEIKEKDLEQLVVTRKLGLKYLVAYDRDFQNQQEYKTPKEFIKLIGHMEAETEF